MGVYDKDRRIIRDLAGRYYNVANSDVNMERIGLYKAANDLKMIRPVVLINELPWHELNIDGELDLYCENEQTRAMELFFRRELFKQKHFPCDIYMRHYFPVFKQCDFGHMEGLKVDERLIENAFGGYIDAHEYHDVLQNEDDLEKLHWVPGYYDRDATMAQYSFSAELIGDIMPVKVCGHQVGMGHVLWDNVARYRGVEPLLNDLIERPDFMHKVARKLTDGFIRSVECATELNLLAPPDFGELHCSPAFTNDIASVDDYDHVRPENTWGRGVAQIFGYVSPAMHDEFDTQYMVEALKPFGLVYYGCCERLDNKIHILKQIRNLRKISITPWSDVNVAAEIIGTDYEMAVKPNPANVGVGFDEDVIKKEFDMIFNAARKNHCAFDMVLKDISTVAHKPQNLFTWARIASEYARSY